MKLIGSNEFSEWRSWPALCNSHRHNRPTIRPATVCSTQMAYWAKNYVTVLPRAAHGM